MQAMCCPCGCQSMSGFAQWEARLEAGTDCFNLRQAGTPTRRHAARGNAAHTCRGDSHDGISVLICLRVGGSPPAEVRHSGQHTVAQHCQVVCKTADIQHIRE
jgi:hypothetical protein